MEKGHAPMLLPRLGEVAIESDALGALLEGVVEPPLLAQMKCEDAEGLLGCRLRRLSPNRTTY